MKKLLSLILILAMAVSFGACGSKTEEGTTAVSQSADETGVTLPPDDSSVKLGKLVKLEETPFVLNSLVLKGSETGSQGNLNIFKLGENISFYIDAALPESDAGKVKVYCAPYAAGAKAVPAEYVFVSDYAAPAEVGGESFSNSVPADSAEGYYNIFFAYENTVAYKITVKFTK